MRMVAALVVAISAVTTVAEAQPSREDWLAVRQKLQNKAETEQRAAAGGEALHGVSAVAAAGGDALVANVLNLTSYRFFPDFVGNTVVVGEVQNISTSTLTFPGIDFTFYDVLGNPVGSDFGFVFSHNNVRLRASGSYTSALSPGAIGFFKVWTSIPYESWETASYSTSGETFAFDPPLSTVSLSSLNLSSDGTYSGTVQNTGPAFAYFAVVFVAGYEDGLIADVTFTFVNGATIRLPCTGDFTDTAVAPNASAFFSDFFLEPVDQIFRAAIEWDEVGTAPAGQSFAAASGAGSFLVVRACGWTALTTDPWITITSGASSTSWVGTATYTVAANSGAARSGSINISGQVLFNVAQEGAPPPPPPPLPGANYRLFWQHQILGYVAAWNMNGTGLVSGMALSPSQVTDTNWKIVGTGDFNADGHTDLFWQHQRTRLMTIWLMNGTNFMAPGLLNNNTVSDTNWAIRAIADMNGDGKPDLIWQHEVDGWLVVWLMDGTNLVRGVFLSPNRVADTNWRIAAAADFNNDGHMDLLWQHAVTGLMTVWLMNGTTFMAPGLISNNTVADTGWKIKVVVDVDGNGWPDFIWHHRTTGLLAVWFMEGTTFLSGRFLTPDRVTDINWHLVGPR